MTPVVTWQALPLAVVLSSFVPGVAIMFLREEQHRLRSTLNMAGAVAKVLLVAVLLQGVAAGVRYEWRLEVVPGLALSLVADTLALLFVTLSAVLWLLTTLYAIGYLEGSPNRTRFFSFFSFCVTATTGIAFAGDLFTFVLFYEALTWTTYPLVVHDGTPEARQAGMRYLIYTVGSGTVLMVGAVWFQVTTGSVDFASGGIVDTLAVQADPQRYRRLFLLLLAGLAVKAAFVPFHGWLPSAMVAPAPVSALLHAVAVVKAGAFGVLRLLHSLFGMEAAGALGVTAVVAALAVSSILYGSLRALAQDDLKRLLAFSTVSQLSYIALGVSFLTPAAQMGGLVHLVHQGIMKITLFFCAGLLAETLHVKRVSQMAGVARRMPLTMFAFTVAALGMIGLPPTAGFVSKWYLATGALTAGAPWVVAVLLVSGLLNATYFLPIIKTAYLDEPSGTWASGGDGRRLEADWRLVLPALATAAITLGAGLMAASPWSPVGWARLIVERGIQ
jgi:multicomponent Na+:H+ antiporter subunit D